MEYVREIVDSSVLDHVITLPRSFHDRKVEILVFPVCDDKEKKININQKKINELMEGSITQSLIGAVPHPDITLDEIRSLRLQKYDSPN
jgi:hypothetical protein